MIITRQLSLNETILLRGILQHFGSYGRYGYRHHPYFLFREIPSGICSEITNALLGDNSHEVYKETHNGFPVILIYRVDYVDPIFVSIDGGNSFLCPNWAKY